MIEGYGRKNKAYLFGGGNNLKTTVVMRNVYTNTSTKQSSM